jgi:hypothetical protein
MSKDMVTADQRRSMNSSTVRPAWSMMLRSVPPGNVLAAMIGDDGAAGWGRGVLENPVAAFRAHLH